MGDDERYTYIYTKRVGIRIECCALRKLNAINLRFVCDPVPVCDVLLLLYFTFVSPPFVFILKLSSHNNGRTDARHFVLICARYLWSTPLCVCVCVLCAHIENEEIKRDEQIFGERRKWWCWWRKKASTQQNRSRKILPEEHRRIFHVYIARNVNIFSLNRSFVLEPAPLRSFHVNSESRCECWVESLSALVMRAASERKPLHSTSTSTSLYNLTKILIAHFN